MNGTAVSNKNILSQWSREVKAENTKKNLNKKIFFKTCNIYINAIFVAFWVKRLVFKIHILYFVKVKYYISTYAFILNMNFEIHSPLRWFSLFFSYIHTKEVLGYWKSSTFFCIFNKFEVFLDVLNTICQFSKNISLPVSVKYEFCKLYNSVTSAKISKNLYI